MNMVECIICHELFDARFDWQKICQSCYRAGWHQKKDGSTYRVKPATETMETLTAAKPSKQTAEPAPKDAGQSNSTIEKRIVDLVQDNKSILEWCVLLNQKLDKLIECHGIREGEEHQFFNAFGGSMTPKKEGKS